MAECKRCGKTAPTVMAYGTEVFVCCGFPLVGTDRTLRLRDHIEFGRLAEEARVLQYQNRIRDLEAKVSDLQSMVDGFRHAESLYYRIEGTDQRIHGLKRLLTATQRRKVVAMVVVMLKELAHKHRLAENAAAATIGSACPLPGSVSLTYDALADALRYGLEVKSADLVEVMDVFEPMAGPDHRTGAGLEVDDGGAPSEAGDQADCGGSSGPETGDFHDFWYGSK